MERLTKLLLGVPQEVVNIQQLGSEDQIHFTYLVVLAVETHLRAT